MQIIGSNLAIIVALHILFRIGDWLVPNKDSGLYAFISHFRVMLILPIFIVTRILSTLWFAGRILDFRMIKHKFFLDVANAAFRYRGSTSRSSTSIDISRSASDFLHSIVVELVFLVQAICFAQIPDLFFASPLVSYIGWSGSLVYMSLLHSLYSFE